MGLLARLLGTEDEGTRHESGTRRAATPGQSSDDARALERYRYMLRTAPPETIEQAHAEAFAKLTPEQRRQVLNELTNAAPGPERPALRNVSPDDPEAMGRLATRTEMRQPGFMERTLGGGGIGFGSSLLGSFAFGFLGSMVANSFFASMAGDAAHGAIGEAGASDEPPPEDDPDLGEGTEVDGELGDIDLGGGDFDV